ncbi:MAG TPA: hypothetical protein VF185_03985 [Patescibacteria group bacterium]
MVEQIKFGVLSSKEFPWEESGFSVSLYNRTVHCKRLAFPSKLGFSFEITPPEVIFSVSGLPGRFFLRTNKAFGLLNEVERKHIIGYIVSHVDGNPRRFFDIDGDYSEMITREIDEALKEKEKSAFPK